MDKKKEVKIKNGDIYCGYCGEFLGMSCDPFAGVDKHVDACKKDKSKTK